MTSFDFTPFYRSTVGFDRLFSLAGQANRDGKGVAVVLLGGAGVGKSHLLSRLYRWAIEEVEPDRPRACYVYLLNIMADPDRLPRYLLKCVVSLLSGSGQAAYLHHRLREELGADELEHRRLRVML